MTPGGTITIDNRDMTHLPVAGRIRAGLGYIPEERMRDGVIPAEPATFESLLEEARRLTRLSHALLQTAAGEPQDSTLAPTDVARSIAGAAALLEPAFARHNLTLEVEVPDGLAVLAAPDQLTQVVFNLLHNASRYSEVGGIVRVTAGAAGGAIRVEVTNAGHEIPPEVATRVFERFFRADASRDRSTGGAGIGQVCFMRNSTRRTEHSGLWQYHSRFQDAQERHRRALARLPATVEQKPLPSLVTRSALVLISLT